MLPLAMAEQGPETYTGQIVRLLESCMAQTGKPRGKLLGVGVTLPGPVDNRTGEVLQLCGVPTLAAVSPLGQRLREAIGCPVVVDKDVYAVLEFVRPDGRGAEHRRQLRVPERVRGHRLRGDDQRAGVPRRATASPGKSATLTLRKDGIPCACGNIGCLELYCSDIGIVQQYNAQTGKKLQTVAEVMALAQGGDAVASRIISQSIGYLVDTTATIIMTYDPQELLIFCTWLHDQRALYFLMLDTLYAKSIFTPEARRADSPDGGKPAQPEGRRGAGRAAGPAGAGGQSILSAASKRTSEGEKLSLLRERRAPRLRRGCAPCRCPPTPRTGGRRSPSGSARG